MLRSHRDGLLLLFATQTLFFASILFHGEVIFPHDNSAEVGAPPVASAASAPMNRRFSDQSSVYIPEIHHQLHGNHAGWISTWNPHVEMGRPTMQISGFSRAFALTNVLSWVVTDAFWLYTWLAVSAVILSGLFGYLLLRSFCLHPAACLTGALGLSLGVFPAFWLTFAMYIWGFCWTLALLWLVKRFVDRATIAGGVGIAFSVHALLLTAYPQQIVWHAYICVGFTMLVLGRRPGTWRGRAIVGTLILSAVLVGIASAAPVYLDLALNASRSGRLAVTVDDDFFLGALPHVASPAELTLFLAQLFDAFWFGNPSRPDYVSPRFAGICLTPVLSVLMIFSLVEPKRRRLWPVHLFVAVCLAMTLWPGAYAWGIEHLGLSLSAWVPLAAAHIPAMFLAADGADRVLRHGLARPLATSVAASVPVVPGLMIALDPDSTVDGRRLTVGMGLWLGTLVLIWFRKSALLGALAVATVLLYASQVALIRPRGSIRETSPSVEWLRRETADGSRFAWVGGHRLEYLPANQEALLGLRSVHTYNSLSSRAYQEWVLRISRHGAAVYGRRFGSVTSLRLAHDLDLDLWGVGVLLTKRTLPPSLGSLSASFEGGLRAYAPVRSPRHAARIGRYRRDDVGRISLVAELEESRLSRVERTLDQDDRVRFRLTPTGDESLLVVSAQHHPQWRAFAGGDELETVLVDGFYQGAVLPPGTTVVELRFLPFVRFAWIPQVFFLLAGTLAVAHTSLRRRRSGGTDA